MDEVKKKLQKKPTCACDIEVEPTEEDIRIQKEAENRGLMFLFIIFGGIALIFGAIFFIPKFMPAGDNPDVTVESYDYNGFYFSKTDGIWFTQGFQNNDNYKIALRYGPRELENVSVIGDISKTRETTKIYITSNPDVPDEFAKYTVLSIAEVATKLAAHFGVATLPAISKPTNVSGFEGIDVVNCDNKTANVMLFQKGPGPKVIVYDNCIIIQGEEFDMVKAADRYMLGYYGIME